jgi:hypothetical protein
MGIRQWTVTCLVTVDERADVPEHQQPEYIRERLRRAASAIPAQDGLFVSVDDVKPAPRKL